MAKYDKLGRLYLAGEWRDGSGKPLTNVSPWDESTIFEMKGAAADDVDEAYRASAEAQKEWAKLPPAARSGRSRCRLQSSANDAPKPLKRLVPRGGIEPPTP